MCSRHPTVADPDAAIRALEPDTPLRYMLTSGSTGLPKIVVQTHRMWCTLMSGATEVLAEASGWGVRTLDWMPWSHVAGASVLMGSLANGGTFYLDDGRPTPELFGATLRNLAEVQPLFFANVPAAFAMLCDAVEADPDLRRGSSSTSSCACTAGPGCRSRSTTGSSGWPSRPSANASCSPPGTARPRRQPG